MKNKIINKQSNKQLNVPAVGGQFKKRQTLNEEYVKENTHFTKDQ